MHDMKRLTFYVSIYIFGFVTAMHSQQVKILFTKQMEKVAGNEIEVITVDYAPGAVDAIDRHDAHAVVHVLEGQVEMQVRGGALQRPSRGRVFYESPQDAHTVSRNEA